MFRLTSTKVNVLAAVAGCALVVGYAPLASACTYKTHVSNTHYHSVTKTTTEIESEAVEAVKHFSNVNVHEHTVTHDTDKDMTNVVSNVCSKVYDGWSRARSFDYGVSRDSRFCHLSRYRRECRLAKHGCRYPHGCSLLD
jgi:hypothetical protein